MKAPIFFLKIEMDEEDENVWIGSGNLLGPDEKIIGTCPENVVNQFVRGYNQMFAAQTREIFRAIGK